MNKLIKGLAVTGLALATFSATSTTASAAKVRTIPKSMRGTWYDKPSFSKKSEIKLTKYTYTFWDGKYKMVGSLKFKPRGHGALAKMGRYHGKNFYGSLWTEHYLGSPWYSLNVGTLGEVPAMRRTHSYLYDDSGKSYRYPAIEISFSHVYGEDSGFPANDYYFKASSWE
jgi:hypothetical protein